MDDFVVQDEEVEDLGEEGGDMNDQSDFEYDEEDIALIQK
jgi:hypothetical protein